MYIEFSLLPNQLGSVLFLCYWLCYFLLNSLGLNCTERLFFEFKGQETPALLDKSKTVKTVYSPGLFASHWLQNDSTPLAPGELHQASRYKLTHYSTKQSNSRLLGRHQQLEVHPFA
jgi:hypothetical protein